MNMQSDLEIANISDVGRKRPQNEDSTGTDQAIGLAVLADGMGGYRAGEVASAIAVGAIMQTVKSGLRNLRRRGANDSTGYSQESLLIKKAISDANLSIFNTAKSEAACYGMGTTIVAALFYGERLSIANVGDSRLYRLRGGEFRQITSDHSLTQELIDRGLYSREQVSVNTPKNLVTRALGIETTVQIDILEEEVRPGDIYMLCSDGLNDMVNDEEIHLTLRKYSANLVVSARELVRLANKNGGKDNISVILMRRVDAEKKNAGITRKLLNRFS